MAITVDDSTIARFSDNDGQGISASFDPPDNCLIVVGVHSFDATRDVFDSIDGSTKPWEQIVITTAGFSSWHVKWFGVGVGSMTISANDGQGGLGPFISAKAYILTPSAGNFLNIAQVNRGTSVTNNLNAPVCTTLVDGSRVFGAGTDTTTNLVAPTSSDVESAGVNSGSASFLDAYKSADTATAGTAVTINMDADGAAAAAWSWAGMEVFESTVRVPWLFAAGALFAAASGTSITPVIPANDALNDILIMGVMCNGSTTFSTPTNWTLLGTSIESNANQSTAWFWKRASGSDGNPTSTTSATLSGTVGGYGRIWVFRDCVTTGNPFEDVTMNGAPTSSTTPASATIDTTATLRLVMSFVLVDDDNTWASGMPALGWWDIGGRVASTTGGDAMFDAFGLVAPIVATVTGVTVGTMNAADFWRTLTMALIPIAAAVDSLTFRNIFVVPSVPVHQSYYW